MRNSILLLQTQRCYSLRGGGSWHKLEGANLEGKTPLLTALSCNQSDSCLFMSLFIFTYISVCMDMYLITYGHGKYIYYLFIE